MRNLPALAPFFCFFLTTFFVTSLPSSLQIKIFSSLNLSPKLKVDSLVRFRTCNFSKILNLHLTAPRMRISICKLGLESFFFIKRVSRVSENGDWLPLDGVAHDLGALGALVAERVLRVGQRVQHVLLLQHRVLEVRIRGEVELQSEALQMSNLSLRLQNCFSFNISFQMLAFRVVPKIMPFWLAGLNFNTSSDRHQNVIKWSLFCNLYCFWYYLLTTGSVVQ